MKVTYYTHRYEGSGDEPCGARGAVEEPRPGRPAYYTVGGARVSDGPCGLPRMLHEQGPLAQHAAAPRAVRVEEADLRRWRRLDAPIGRRIQEARADVPKNGSRHARGAAKALDAAGEVRSDDVRVLVSRALLDRLAHLGSTELVTDHARRLLRTTSEHPWPLLVVHEREAVVEVAPPREALQLLRARPSQRARLSASRRSVAERLTAALGRAAQTEDLETRARILADAIQAAAVRLDAAEAPAEDRPRPRSRPRGSMQVMTGALATLRRR